MSYSGRTPWSGSGHVIASECGSRERDDHRRFVHCFSRRLRIASEAAAPRARRRDRQTTRQHPARSDRPCVVVAFGPIAASRRQRKRQHRLAAANRICDTPNPPPATYFARGLDLVVPCVGHDDARYHQLPGQLGHAHHTAEQVANYLGGAFRRPRSLRHRQDCRFCNPGQHLRRPLHRRIHLAHSTRFVPSATHLVRMVHSCRPCAFDDLPRPASPDLRFTVAASAGRTASRAAVPSSSINLCYGALSRTTSLRSALQPGLTTHPVITHPCATGQCSCRSTSTAGTDSSASHSTLAAITASTSTRSPTRAAICLCKRRPRVAM